MILCYIDNFMWLCGQLCKVVYFAMFWSVDVDMWCLWIMDILSILFVWNGHCFVDKLSICG